MSLLTTVRTKRTGLMATAAGALLAGGFLTMPSAFATNDNSNGDNNPHNQVGICHHRMDQKDPYIFITVNANGSVSGHAGQSHQDGLDIIPSFQYNDNGVTKTFEGQNLNVVLPGTGGEVGSVFLANGCVITVVTTPPVTTPPVTTPPVTTPPVTTPPVTTPPATTPAVVPPVTNGTSPAVVPPAVVPGAVQPGAPGGQAMAGNAAPASVGVSAETSVSAAPADYTVPGLLLGSGTLLAAWLALTLWMKRRRGEHR